MLLYAKSPILHSKSCITRLVISSNGLRVCEVQSIWANEVSHKYCFMCSLCHYQTSERRGAYCSACVQTNIGLFHPSPPRYDGIINSDLMRSFSSVVDSLATYGNRVRRKCFILSNAVSL